MIISEMNKLVCKILIEKTFGYVTIGHNNVVTVANVFSDNPINLHNPLHDFIHVDFLVDQ